MGPRSYVRNGEASMSEDEAFTRLAVPIVILVIVLCAAGMAWGETGLRKGEHSTPLPKGLTMLTPDIYLIGDDASITASELCKFGGVDRNVRAEGLKADLAVCYDDQTWNVHKGPAQSFIPDGIVHTATRPWFWILSGVLAFLAFPWTFLMALRLARKDRKARARIERNRVQSARELLVAQWARSDRLDIDDPAYISQADFEKKLGELDAKLGA